jgi:hypothetical protein
LKAELTTIPAICSVLLIATETQGQVINYFITIIAATFLSALLFVAKYLKNGVLIFCKKLLNFSENFS